MNSQLLVYTRLLLSFLFPFAPLHWHRCSCRELRHGFSLYLPARSASQPGFLHGRGFACCSQRALLGMADGWQQHPVAHHNQEPG